MKSRKIIIMLPLLVCMSFVSCDMLLEMSNSPVLDDSNSHIGTWLINTIIQKIDGDEYNYYTQDLENENMALFKMDADTLYYYDNYNEDKEFTYQIKSYTRVGNIINIQDMEFEILLENNVLTMTYTTVDTDDDDMDGNTTEVVEFIYTLTEDTTTDLSNAILLNP